MPFNIFYLIIYQYFFQTNKYKTQSKQNNLLTYLLFLLICLALHRNPLHCPFDTCFFF